MILQVYNARHKFLGSVDITGTLFQVESRSFSNTTIIRIPIKYKGKPRSFKLVDFTGAFVYKKGVIKMPHSNDMLPGVNLAFAPGDLVLSIDEMQPASTKKSRQGSK